MVFFPLRLFLPHDLDMNLSPFIKERACRNCYWRYTEKNESPHVRSCRHQDVHRWVELGRDCHTDQCLVHLPNRRESRPVTHDGCIHYRKTPARIGRILHPQVMNGPATDIIELIEEPLSISVIIELRVPPDGPDISVAKCFMSLYHFFLSKKRS